MKTLPDDIIAAIESEIQRRTTEISRYNIRQNSDDHLLLVAIPIARDVITTILFTDEVTDRVTPWLNESAKEDKRREKHPERCREIPPPLKGHSTDGPARITNIEFLVYEYSLQMVDSYRPKVIHSEHAVPKSIKYANTVFEEDLVKPNPIYRGVRKETQTARYHREKAAISLAMLTKHESGISVIPLFKCLEMAYDALHEFIESRSMSSIGHDYAVARLAHHLCKPYPHDVGEAFSNDNQDLFQTV